MKLGQVIEKRMKAMKERREQLVEAWKPYLDAVDSYKKGVDGTSMTDYDKANVAQCLENALIEGGMRQSSKVFETTYADNITFLGVQLPVIAALLPSLVLNKIAIVQALDRRQGAVFYLDVKSGQAKGSVASGTTLLDAKTGQLSTPGGRTYASELVEDENIGALGSTAYSGTVTYFPVVAGSMTITDGTETFTDDGSGVLVSDVSGGADGTIVYATGVYSVVFDSATTVAPTTDYQYNYEKATNGVPEIDISMRSETITAIDFPLRAKYTLGSAIDLEKAHGLNLEDELVKYLGGEIKFDIDHHGIDLIYNAAIGASAATTAGTWNGKPNTGQEWLWKKYEILDTIEYGSNNIFAKTLRGNCNFILCGNNVARVLRQMGDHFKAAPGLDTAAQTGPFELGKLDGRLVIQDPFLPTNRFVLGYRGDNYLMAGFIYAPYIPLFSTPTLITSDLVAQKGFLSAAGFKVINPGLFCYGDVDLTSVR